MSQYADIFRQKIKKFADSNGGQAELARALKVSPQNISKWLHDDANPSLSSLEKIATAMGCEPWELIKPSSPPDFASETALFLRDKIRTAEALVARWKADVLEAECTRGEMYAKDIDKEQSRTKKAISRHTALLRNLYVTLSEFEEKLPAISPGLKLAADRDSELLTAIHTLDKGQFETVRILVNGLAAANLANNGEKNQKG